MRVTPQMFEATNRFATRPVILFREIEAGGQDIPRQARHLFGLLYGTAEAPFDADGGDDAGEVLARFAVHMQTGLGVADMRVIAVAENGSAARKGFECLTLGLGRDILRTLVTLFTPPAGREVDAAKAQAILTRLTDLWQPRMAHYSTRVALRQDIPWQFISGSTMPLMALGQGRKRRLFWRNMTPETSEIGVVFSTPKHTSGAMLHDAGLPVPQQALARDAAHALAIAESIGWPVVIKPTRTDFGIGITTNIRDRDTVTKAFELAQKHGEVLVMKHVEGDGHRLLVHDGKCISAVRQKAAQVVGDGKHKVAELIEQANATRTDHLSLDWKKIKVDAGLVHTLERAGLDLESVPERGQAVLLRTNTNLSQGGTIENVTDQVHEANRAIVEMAADVFGLDLAGIDVQSKDITRPLTENGGALIEVNPTPGFMQAEAEFFIEDRVIGRFFPGPRKGRVPTVVCLSDTPDIAQALAASLAGNMRGLALSVPGDVIVAGVPLSAGASATAPRRTRIALTNPRTECAILSLTPEEVLEQGLGVDRVDVVVATGRLSAAGRDALICLGRAASTAIVSDTDLDLLRSGERRGPQLVCLTDDIRGRTVQAVSAVQPSEGQTVLWKPPGEDPRPENAPYDGIEGAPLAIAFVVARALADDPVLDERSP